MRYPAGLRRFIGVVVVAAGVVALVAGCATVQRAPHIDVPGGDPQVGATLIRQWGCGSCHVVPGIRGASGLVGPSLSDFARRAYIAGNLTNNAENLVHWIMDPQAIEPGTAMPDLNVNEEVARHMAAYLYTVGR